MTRRTAVWTDWPARRSRAWAGDEPIEHAADRTALRESQPSGRRHGATQGKTYRDIILQDLLDEELARLPKARRVVRLKSTVNDVCYCFAAGDGRRADSA